MSEENWYKFYEHYGVHVHSPDKKESLIECPHCLEDKAYLSKSKGTYDCKLCHEKGNQYTFIRHLASQFKDSSNRNNVRELAKRKGLDANFLMQMGVFEHEGTVYIPVWNKEGKLIGARQFNFEQNKIYNPPAFCKPNFWRWNDEVSKTYVFEADFDAIAYLAESRGDRRLVWNWKEVPLYSLSSSTLFFLGIIV